MGKENINGLMAEPMKETGSKIKWVAKGYLVGQMEDSTKENIMMTKSKAMGNFLGVDKIILNNYIILFILTSWWKDI